MLPEPPARPDPPLAAERSPIRLPAGERRLLLGLVLFGLLSRLALLAYAPRLIRWDEADYLLLGKSLWSGQGLRIADVTDLHFPPLLPLLFGPLVRVFENPEWASNFWYLVCGALLPWPVYSLARRIHGPVVAGWSAGLTALFPLLTISPLHWGTMSEPPYLILLFFGIDWTHRAVRERSTRDGALAGAALGLAYLARPEGVVAAAVAGTALVGWGLARRAPSARRALAPALAFALAFTALASPYVLFLRRHTGQWRLTGKTGITLELWGPTMRPDPAAYDRAVARLDSRGEEILWYSPERFAIPGLLERGPREVLARLRGNLGRVGSGLWRRWPFLIPLVLLAGWGVVAAARTRRERADLLFLALMALPPLVFLPVRIQTRFFVPWVPIFLIWACAALVGVGGWLASRTRRPALRHAPAAATALALLALWPPVLARGQRTLDLGHKEMGLWLRQHSAPRVILMTRDPAVALYADRDSVRCPHAPLDDILRYGRRRAADLWATDAEELTVVKPHLSPLLDPGRRPAGMSELYRRPSRAGANLVLRLPPA
jgi:hypothetical protein